MKYMGSKSRIAKHILPIMLKDRKEGQFWVEPFVGGANIIDKVTGPRIGSDINTYVIEALTDIRDNVNLLPKDNSEFTEEMYKQLKDNNDYRFKGYIGFTASYGAKWLGGWGRGTGRDYIAESYRGAVKQSPLLHGIDFKLCSYNKLDIPNNSIIYCDPPYENTTKYKTELFNHEDFWWWCRDMSYLGHTVFVSEYNAPRDFKMLWQKEIISSITKGKKAVEKLFTI